MPMQHPILAAKEKTAAAMLDMPVVRFRALVARGALPQPLRIGDQERWRVADLDAILNSDAGKPRDEDIEL